MVLTIIFIIVMCIDNILPFVLAKFYKGYSHKRMALSVLGAKQSPVKRFYNAWCIVSGLCFVACSTYIAALRTTGLTVAVAVLLSVYGFACEIISGFFPLNERLYVSASRSAFNRHLFYKKSCGIDYIDIVLCFRHVVLLLFHHGR